MPSTITTFHNFTADTKARASEVNTNFSNYRGDLLPINTDTTTASHRSHDLGATDHYWNNLYTQNISIGLTSTSATVFNALTVGGFDILVSGSTIGGLTANGLSAFNETPMEFTTSAARGQFLRSSTLATAGNGTTFVTIGAAAFTLVTRGRPVKFGLMGAGSLASPSYISEGATIAANTQGIIVAFVVDGSTIDVQQSKAIWFSSTTGQSLHDPGMFYTYCSLAAGSHIFDIEIRNSHASNTFTATNVRFYAYEIGGP